MRHKLGLIFIFAFLGALLAVKGSEPVEPATPSVNMELSGLADETLKKLTSQGEAHIFEAEVDKMMKLIINSLYKNKEIFLRELISNASDALDKIRLISLSRPEELKTNTDLHIFVKADKEKRQLIIRDSGIGMTKEDLIKNLGTIAKSGTADFMSKFQEAKTEQETSDLIGQFGVGFYSAFLVADKITVISKHNDDRQFVWESDSTKFSINRDPRGDTLKRGTEIILHLKDEAQDYLKDSTLKEIVKRYSQFINFPIYLWESEKRMVDEETPADKTEKADQEKKDEDSVEEEKDEEKKEKKQVEKEFWDWKQVNSQKPIWKRSPSEVTKEEYETFFSVVAPNNYEKPLSHIHFKAEGDINFNAIMYIPDNVYGDFFATDESNRARPMVKLYVRRVFITDEIQDLIPRYLGFIRGVVDSEDLPLNVSRETLQQSKMLRLIKKKLIRKIIEMIQKMDKEKFDKFWEKFSINMKVGIWEDRTNSARIAKLLRFKSTKASGEKEFTTLSEYLDRIKKGQKKIFYMTGPSVKEALKSPFVERAMKMGYEVLLLVDSVDEHMMNALTQFEEYKFQNLAKEGVEFDESDEAKAAQESLKEEFKVLTDWLTNDVLKEKIGKAQISNLLTSSPCAIVSPEHAWSSNMERMMLSNSYKSHDDASLKYQMNQKRTLDINPRHPLIKELRMLVSQDEKSEKASEMAILLYESALLRSGFLIHDAEGMAKRIENVMRKNMGISEDAMVDEDPTLREVPAAKEEQKKKEEEEETQGPEEAGQETAKDVKDEL